MWAERVTGSSLPPLYTFIDEGGNFDFSPSGTKYFTLTSVTVQRPFPLEAELAELRYDLLEAGTHLEYFHATQDRQSTRNSVYGLIRGQLHRFRVDSVIVEKRKTAPSIRKPEKFYPMMLGYLLAYVVRGADWGRHSELIAIADRIEEKARRKALEGGVKVALARRLPSGVPYRMLHHESRSSVGLQIADYFNWAVYKKWTDGELRPITAVESAIVSQFDIFGGGTTYWY